MFKAPQPGGAFVGNIGGKPPNLDLLQDKAADVTEATGDGIDPVATVSQDKTLPHTDAISEDNGPLGKSNSAGGLSLDSSSLTTFNANGNKPALPEGKMYQQLQDNPSTDALKRPRN
ncbi:hypothetical protein NDU88_003254 [Pleurodeles waltl]|uniref:Uncharacterized protein n=1 Tax=Pleurodeles waltl TaxID=8319 RepID=A0AAV7KWZ4_PLEWA|nr:hypothetical protein NDU88_003254 [Pleurodeles waltl]